MSGEMVVGGSLLSLFATFIGWIGASSCPMTSLTASGTNAVGDEFLLGPLFRASHVASLVGSRET